MKRPPKRGDERRCLRCYLASIVWPFGIPLLSILAEQRGLVELPDLVLVLLMVPGALSGCTAGS